MNEKPYNILIVDDSPIVLDTFSCLLDSEGFRPILASTGAEALRLVETESIDLVILDVRMPGLSGFDVLKSLRRSHSSDELPVIMATAVGDSNDVVEAFEIGADDYVTKPLDFPVVLARIQTRLRSKARAAQKSGPASGTQWAEVEPGTVLEGKYRLESQIGRGQFGVVYRATHLELRRPVAVKVLKTGAHGEDLAARFRREGMSTCRIQHPNAVAVHDFSFTTAGLPFLVMELLEGDALDVELERRGRLSPARCVELLLPICEVLGEAHSLGIIHRDVKPQNIFLHRQRQGEMVKVLDFGLAKLIGDAVWNQRLTLEGLGPGTPLYMAPERFAELPYDGRADVYSLGIMAYEMLVGQPPFVSADGNPVSVALMHLNDPPPPILDLAPEVPSAVEEVVLRALDKDPENRPPAVELGRLFAAALSSDEPRPPGRDSPRRQPGKRGNRNLSNGQAPLWTRDDPGGSRQIRRKSQKSSQPPLFRDSPTLPFLPRVDARKSSAGLA